MPIRPQWKPPTRLHKEIWVVSNDARTGPPSEAEICPNAADIGASSSTFGLNPSKCDGQLEWNRPELARHRQKLATLRTDLKRLRSSMSRHTVGTFIFFPILQRAPAYIAPTCSGVVFHRLWPTLYQLGHGFDQIWCSFDQV